MNDTPTPASTDPLAPVTPANDKEIPAMTDSTLATPTTDFGATTAATPPRSEAKTRFSAALDEAKAGAAALKAEGADRAAAYRDQAKGKGADWVAEAKAYGADAKLKSRDLATDGKDQAAKGLRSLGQVVSDNAHLVDEKLGAKYGDYARSASGTLSQYADSLETKSVDELAEDARALIRKSPGAAVGAAAVVGFMLSRLFSRSR